MLMVPGSGSQLGVGPLSFAPLLPVPGFTPCTGITSSQALVCICPGYCSSTAHTVLFSPQPF